MASSEPKAKIPFKTNDPVWFMNGSGYPEPGIFVKVNNDHSKLYIQNSNQKDMVVETEPGNVWKRYEEVMAFEDLISLEDVSDSASLWALKKRFDYGKFYTYIGDVLVTMNPNLQVEMSAKDLMDLYHSNPAKSLQAHPYGFAASVHHQMNNFQNSHNIVATGIAGSGKSTVCRDLIKYFTSKNFQFPRHEINDKSIKCVNYILDAFTCAKTCENDNSTRCIKICKLNYDNKTIVSAKFSVYALERNRTVSHGKRDSNFHIFYRLLSGLDAQKKQLFGLTEAKNYFYLNMGRKCCDSQLYPFDDYKQLEGAFEELKIKADQQYCLARLLAALLHLGNVYFEEKQDEKGISNLTIVNVNEAQWAAYLMQMDPENLVEKLTAKTITQDENKITQSLSINRALDIRDAIAKELYGGIVEWIIDRINKYFGEESGNNYIEVVDTCGFECHIGNSFEQLCTNFINEKIHEFFVRATFCSEQLECSEQEAVLDCNIGYSLTNDSIISLFSKKPNGILHLLNDECSFPKGNDELFLTKCNNNHEKNPLFKIKKGKTNGFIIKHFFGPIRYVVENFVDQNRRIPREYAMKILLDSQNAFIHNMFAGIGECASHNCTTASDTAQTKCINDKTTFTMLQDEISRLVQRLDKSIPHFVRCLNSNASRQPNQFDLPFVYKQLTALGLSETLKIQKYGFPYKITFRDFIQRYSRLDLDSKFQNDTQARNVCLRILTEYADQYMQDYHIGRTKVLMKDTVVDYLEKLTKEYLERCVVNVQRYCRGYLARKRYIRDINFIVSVQCRIRGALARKRFAQMKVNAMEQVKKSAAHSKTLNCFRYLSAAAGSPVDTSRRLSILANVTNIEIPKLIRNLMDKSGMFTEHYVKKSEFESVHCTQEPILPQDLGNYPFERFVETFFMYHDWKSRRDPISTPFLQKDNEKVISLALTLFKLILLYMNDSSLTEYQEFLLANFIIQQGIRAPILRDEIYAQIINQIHKNPNETNGECGWRLMALCACIFPPSPVMFKYVLNYVTTTRCGGWKMFIASKLLHSVQDENGTTRMYPPSFLEHKSSKSKSRMVLSSYLSDDCMLRAHVESWTKADEFSELSLRYSNIVDRDGWTVSIENHSMALHLGGHQYILDAISYLEHPREFPLQESNYLKTVKEEQQPESAEVSRIDRLKEFQERRRTPLSTGRMSAEVNRRRIYNGRKCSESGSFNDGWNEFNQPQFDWQNACNPENFIHAGSVDNFLSDLMNRDATQNHSVSRLIDSIKGGKDIEQNEPNDPVINDFNSVENQNMPPHGPPYVPPGFLMMPYSAGRMIMNDMQHMNEYSMNNLSQEFPAPGFGDPARILVNRNFEGSNGTLMPFFMTPFQHAPYGQYPEIYPQRGWIGTMPSQRHTTETEQQIASGSSDMGNSSLHNSQRNISTSQSSVAGRCFGSKSKCNVMDPPHENTTFRKLDSNNMEMRQSTEYQHFSYGSGTDSLLQGCPKDNGRSKVSDRKPMSKLNNARHDVENNSRGRPCWYNSQFHPTSWDKSEFYQMNNVTHGRDWSVNRIPASTESQNGRKGYVNYDWIDRPQSQFSRNPMGSYPIPLNTDSCSLSTTSRDSQTKLLVDLNQGPMINSYNKTWSSEQRGHAESSLENSTIKQQYHCDSASRTSSLCRDSYIEANRLRNLEAILSPIDAFREKRKGYFLTYGQTAWKIFLRKEIFLPNGTVEDPAAINAIFQQIIRDCYHEKPNIRMDKTEKHQMLRLLGVSGIYPDSENLENVPQQLKKHVIQIARSWPLYFCRFYPVYVQKSKANVPHYLGISERGIWLLTRPQENSNELAIECFEYEEIDHAETTRNELAISTVNGIVIRVITESPEEIANLINKFLLGPNEGKQLVRATSDYITEEPNLLSFRKGQTIQLVKTIPPGAQQGGWLYGKIDSTCGFFPKEHLEEQHAEEDFSAVSDVPDGQGQLDESTAASVFQAPHEKLTMLEFAMLYFRKNAKGESTQNGAFPSSLKRKSKKEWTWKETADLVKFTKVPIDNSLLQLDKTPLNKVAVECFLNLMMYMGDYPLKKDTSHLDCVYKVLSHCKENVTICDEVYCQVIKQLTSNKSTKPDSCLMGWRMMSILTAYFDTSDVFRPYLMKYLKDAASDSRRPYHGTATECYQNFRQTLQYGGRRCLLSPKELESISQGKNLKRQVYHLPGGTKKVINTKSITVVEEVIRQLCRDLNVRSPLEQQEFSLFVIIEPDSAMRILSNNEYILDLTTELEKDGLEHFILLKRIVWIHPLRKDNDLYTDVMFYQALPDYLEGLLVVMKGPDSLSAVTMDDIASLGALLACADEEWDGHYLSAKDVGNLLPKNVHNIRHVNQELWADRVNKKITLLPPAITPQSARAGFLELLQTWPLFGSIFFFITFASDPRAKGECLIALNRLGVQFLDTITHESTIELRWGQILSCQKVVGDVPEQEFIEIFYQAAGQQQGITLQTNQGVEISRLFDQYIYIDSQTRGLLSRDVRR